MGEIKKIGAKNFTWIDIHKPSAKDLDALKLKYNLDQSDLDVAKSCGYAGCPRTILRLNYIFLAVLFPKFDYETKFITEAEVGVFLSHDYLLTVHTEKIDEISSAFKELQVNPNLISTRYDESTAYFFYNLLARIYHQILRILNQISQEIKDVETKLLTGEFENNISKILTTKTVILSCKGILQSHRNIITKLFDISSKYFGKKEYIKSYFTELLRHIDDIWEILQTHGDSIESIENTNNSMINFQVTKIESQTNMTIKILMVLTVLTYPLLIIAALFSTNAAYMPIIGIPYDFWIIFSIMTGSTFLIYIVLRKKGWL